jgi:hypothetical protein
MASKKQAYKVTVAGPGHNFERNVDEATAGQILSLIMTGAAAPSHGGAAGAHAGNGAAAPAASTAHSAGKNMSLAAFIKAKKGEKNQVTRFLATASWLTGRGADTLTSSAVAQALSDHHQRGLSNPADCLNKNVTKGHAEKRKDGSFFITPEGLEVLEGAKAE